MSNTTMTSIQSNQVQASDDDRSNSPPVLMQFKDLRFSYPGRTLFTGLSHSIPAGVTLVCGGEGSGKSTLLRLLAGALQANAGDLAINGVLLSKQPAVYRQQVFWAEPRSEAFDQMTPPEYFAAQQLAFPAFDTATLPALIEGLDLAPHLHKQLFMLSTGSKRKVWLAAAFASGAPVTLFDQPFSAIDKPSINFLLTLLQDASASQKRAFVIADYEAPIGVRLTSTIDLGN